MEGEERVIQMEGEEEKIDNTKDVFKEPHGNITL